VAASSGLAISESRITNSSPPWRLTVSEARTLAVIVLKRTEEACRRWHVQRIVDAFEAIQIKKDYSEMFFLPAG